MSRCSTRIQQIGTLRFGRRTTLAVLWIIAMILAINRFVLPLKGRSHPYLVSCSDNQLYVVKSYDNPLGTRSLVSELLGARLADKVGLPVAPATVVAVPQFHLTHDEAALRKPRRHIPPGLHCAIRYVVDPRSGQVYDYLPATMLSHVKDLKTFAGALAFHLWVQNHDRPQVVYWRLHHSSEYRAVFIDHGMCFGGPEWHFDLCQGTGLYYHAAVYNDIQTWDSFEPYLSTIENIRCEELMELASDVPQEWCDDLFSLRAMIIRLYERRLEVRELLKNCIRSHPEYFPNWCAIETVSGLDPIPISAGTNKLVWV